MYAIVEPIFVSKKYSHYPALGGEIALSKMAWNVKDALEQDIDVYIHTQAFIDSPEGHHIYQNALDMLLDVEEAMWQQGYFKVAVIRNGYRYEWVACSDNGYREDNPDYIAFNLRVSRVVEVIVRRNTNNQERKIRMRG
jgi:hypothetical protein